MKDIDVLDTQVEIAELFQLYGDLLSERQNEFLRLYYCENLSLSEIAEQYSISRQAVHDAVKHGRRALVRFEETLGLLKFRNQDPCGSEVVWKNQIETLLDEMERTILEVESDTRVRLMAQFASLRSLLQALPENRQRILNIEEAA